MSWFDETDDKLYEIQAGAYNLNSYANSLLRQAEKIIEKHDAVNKATGGRFNIFSVLGMEHNEVKTHSAFIYDFINPLGSHAQGDIYVRLFVENVLGLESFNIKNLKIKREDPTVENRRIDFSIENDRYFIAIEMKIYALDQHQQLVDYAKHANEYAKKVGKEAKIYYLTLTGNDADETSVRDKDTHEDVAYEKISFSLHILEWVERCINQSALLPTVRETLVQYAKLLRKITNQNEENMDKELINMLLIDNNLRIADNLSKALPEAKAKLELEFWKKVNELLAPILEEYGFTYWLIEDDEKFELILNRQKSGVTIMEIYHEQEYEKGKLFNFSLAYDNYDDRLYVGCYPCAKDCINYIKDGSRACVEMLNQPFRANKHFEYFGNKRNFFGDGIFELLDVSKCYEMAEETVNDFIPYLKLLQKRIDEYFQNKSSTH